jgi:hypothetical protein
MYWFHTGRGFCLSGAEASGPPDIISRVSARALPEFVLMSCAARGGPSLTWGCAEEAKTPQCAHNHSRIGESHVDRSETLRGPPSAAEIADESRCLRWTHTIIRPIPGNPTETPQLPAQPASTGRLSVDFNVVPTVDLNSAAFGPEPALRVRLMIRRKAVARRPNVSTYFHGCSDVVARFHSRTREKKCCVPILVDTSGVRAGILPTSDKDPLGSIQGKC